MEQNKKVGVAIVLSLVLAVVGCLGLGLVVAGLGYFANGDSRTTTLGGPVALIGDDAGVAAEDDAPDEGTFAAELRAALADAGHELVYRPEDSTLRSDGGTTLSLKNLYGEYRNTPPEARAAFVERTVRAMFPPPIPERWEDAKGALLPSVRDQLYLDLLDLRTPGNDVVRKPVSTELVAALVHDGEVSMQFVTHEQLKRWGVTADEAWAAALENLAQREGPRFEKLQEGVYRSPWKDNYDTARVLIPRRLKRLRVKGDPVVFLPHRDVLIVTGSEDDEGLAAAIDAVGEALGLPRATTGRAWRLRGERWEPFLPSPESPVYDELVDLAEDARVMDSNDQKEALDEKYQAEGKELLVGTLFRVQSKKTGERFTYCVLTKTVDSLLPKADWVVFIDLDRPNEEQLVGVAPWDDFKKLLGRAVQPVELPGPDRVRVRGFPNAKQQKSLQADLP